MLDNVTKRDDEAKYTCHDGSSNVTEDRETAVIIHV